MNHIPIPPYLLSLRAWTALCPSSQGTSHVLVMLRCDLFPAPGLDGPDDCLAGPANCCLAFPDTQGHRAAFQPVQ